MGCERTREIRRGEMGGFAGAGKRMKTRTKGDGEEKEKERERERERERESPRYILDDLCGSDAISEASLESGLSSVTPVLVNHRDPPTPVPCSARSQAPTRRCDTTINEVKGGTERLSTELLYARD